MRRGRPLGLTLALWACTLLYGLYPLAEALFYLILITRRSSTPVSPRAFLSLILSVGFLLLMIPAWLGRPPQIRKILTVVVLGLMVINLGLALVDLLNRPTNVLADSSTAITQTADTCSFPIYILVTAYIVWYLNRYPSRAYYNGTRE